MDHLISPSILSCDFLHLEKEIEMLNSSEADWIHIDVMDGVFVPNISFGFSIIGKIHSKTNKPLDVHLMIVDPDRYVSQFSQVGASILTVHYEACRHLHRTIESIKQLGMKAGVSLNPHTPVHLLKDIINDLDLVLIMSVNPGFGGQKFIEQTYAKITDLNELISQKGSKAMIEVDGGVDMENAGKLLETGVDALVVGSYIFHSGNPLQTISLLKGI
jgi:ribulose-phosphate 3-epimerase